MKNITPPFFLVYLLLLTTFCFGQEYTGQTNIQWGPELTTKRSRILLDIVGYDQNGYFALARARGRYYLEHYSPQLDLKNRKKINLWTGYPRKEIEFILQLDHKMYLFTSHHDTLTQKNILYAQGVNKKELTLVAPRIKISEFDYRNRRKDGRFGYALSPDSTRLLIYDELPFRPNKKERFGIKVFDQNLKLLWQKNLHTQFKDRLYDMLSYRVDESGNVYLLGKANHETQSDKKMGRPNFQHYFFFLSDQGNQVLEHKVYLRDKFITDLQFDIMANGTILAAGIYSEKRMSSTRGIFYLRIDPSKQDPLFEKCTPLSSEALAKFISFQQASKHKELREYDLNQVEVRRDGGAVLVAEKYFIQEVTDFSVNSSVTSDLEYHYNNIAVININPDGTIAWVQRIPKRQSTSNKGARDLSYRLALATGKMFFLFNDNAKNLHPNNQKIKRFNGNKESTVVLVTIKGDGSLSKQILSQIKDTNTLTLPRVSQLVGNDKMIIYSRGKRKERFAQLKFD